MSFLQQGEINRTSFPGVDGTTIDEEWYYCHMPVHLSNNFHEVPVEQHRNRGAGERGSVGRTGTAMCQIHAGFAHNDYGIIPSTWLLLDTCSTSSVGKNPDMFKNIWGCLEEERLTVVTNGGKNVFN